MAPTPQEAIPGQARSKRSLFGMAEDKKWLFLAEYSDKTLLRNRLAFELGHRGTLKWTPSGHFAEVFVNGAHRRLPPMKTVRTEWTSEREAFFGDRSA